MRVYAIRNCRPCSAPKIAKPSSFKHGAISAPQCDTVSFGQNNTVKGAGLGAICGIVALAALSAISGGLATPLGYGLYAAAFGTAGGFTGKALDEIEGESTVAVA